MKAVSAHRSHGSCQSQLSGGSLCPRGGCIDSLWPRRMSSVFIFGDSS
jgi:hypothetical protein